MALDKKLCKGGIKMKKIEGNWWKSRSYWLKGGLIGIILGILSFFGLLLCGESVKNIGFGGLMCIPFFMPTIWMRHLIKPLFTLFYNTGLIESDFMVYFEMFLGNTLFFFLIGVTMGWIFGKIKSITMKKRIKK